MAPAVIGVAGNSARWRGWVDRAGLPLLTVIVVLIALRYMPVLTGSNPGGWFGYFLAIAIGLAINIKGIREFYSDYRGSKNWFKGAEGEDLTAAQLDTLSADYIVFHDFHPLGADGEPVDWNIDHIAIGPSGVFIVESKNYSITRIRPSDSDPLTLKNIKQVQRTSAEFKRLLVTWSGGDLARLFVVPVLVYTQPGAFVDKTREKYARVVPLRLLTKEITSSKTQALDPDQAYRIARVLFSRLRPDLKNDYQAALNAFGERSKRFKQERAEELWQQKQNVQSVPSVCPECGGELVRKIAKRGPRTGMAFLGCANFASKNCRFGFNLDESA